MPSLEIVLLSVALCLSAGFQQGYIASVLNQPYTQIQQFINETVKERFDVQISGPTLDMLVSVLHVMFPVSMIFGQFIAAWMCKRLGRRITAIISCALYIPGNALSALALPLRSFELLFIGRIIWCLANGIQSVNATVWIVECAPLSIRGASASFQEFSMALGSLLTIIVAVPVSTDTLWPIVFLPDIPVSIIAAVLCWWLPDSPVSIIEREGDHDKARRSLARYFGVDCDDSSLDAELTHAKKYEAQNGQNRPEEKGIMWVFNPFANGDDRSRVVREAAWLGVMVKIAYVFAGARILRAYSTFVVHELSGFTLQFSQYSSVGMAILRLPITLVPVFFVDRIGRRPLLIGSEVVTVVSLALLTASVMLGKQYQIVSLISFSVVLLITAAGLGSISRFYGAELVPRSMLLSSMAILSQLEAAAKIVAQFAFYPLSHAIRAYVFLVFLVPSVLFLFLIWFRCPETSNMTVQQVLNDIARRKKIPPIFPVQCE